MYTVIVSCVDRNAENMSNPASYAYLYDTEADAMDKAEDLFCTYKQKEKDEKSHFDKYAKCGTITTDKNQIYISVVRATDMRRSCR